MNIAREFIVLQISETYMVYQSSSKSTLLDLPQPFFLTCSYNVLLLFSHHSLEINKKSLKEDL